MPEKKNKTINITLTPEIYERLQKTAAGKGISAAALIRIILSEKLKK